MPRYFFHVRDGVYNADEIGSDLPDIYRAQTEAIKLCGALVSDLGAKFWERGEWKLEVCNHEAKLLFTLTLTANGHDLAAA